MASRGKNETTSRFGTVEKMVYEKLQAGESDIAALARTTRLSKLEVKVAIQLLKYKDVVIFDENDRTFRLKADPDTN